jgi:hypothetical protein
MKDQLPTHREQPAVGEGLTPDEMVSPIIGLAIGFGFTTTDEAPRTPGSWRILKPRAALRGTDICLVRQSRRVISLRYQP